MARYSELDAHREWIGYLQPVGLVVSPPALVRAGVMPSRDVIDLQQRVRTEIRVPPGTMPGEEGAYIADLSGFLTRVLGWDEDDLWGLPDRPVPEELCPALPDYGEVLRPTLAVADTGNGDGPDESGPSWLLLVQAVPRGLDLDTVPPDGDGHGWQASPQARLERLLRDTRLTMIWTGTNEIMNLLIQHEYYRELAREAPGKRDVEGDAQHGDAEEEKVFE